MLSINAPAPDDTKEVLADEITVQKRVPGRRGRARPHRGRDRDRFGSASGTRQQQRHGTGQKEVYGRSKAALLSVSKLGILAARSVENSLSLVKSKGQKGAKRR